MFSYQQKRDLVEGELNKGRDDHNWVWVQDLYEDRAVVNEDGQLIEIMYSIDTDGDEPKVILGDRTPVKVTYEKFTELIGVEVLRVGKHQAMNGTTIEVTGTDLDHFVEVHAKLKDVIKPPLVVSHAEGDENTAITVATIGDPVAGYMSRLYKQGESLLMDFVDVPDKAAEKIGKTLKRISPEIYKNFEHAGEAYGRAFRRISFVPVSAIKDLADVTQEMLAYGEAPDQPTDQLLFSEESPVSKEKTKEAKRMDEKELQKLQESIAKLTEQGETQSKRITELETENKKLKTDGEAQATKLSESETQRRKDSIQTFCEGLAKKGVVIPAMTEMGIELFMESLGSDKGGELLKFGEGDTAVELSQLAFMEKFMAALPVQVKFGEHGVETPDGQPVTKDITEQFGEHVDEDRSELHGKVLKYQEKHPDVDYETALSAVSKGGE